MKISSHTLAENDVMQGLNWHRLSFIGYVLVRNQPAKGLENPLEHIQ